MPNIYAVRGTNTASLSLTIPIYNCTGTSVTVLSYYDDISTSMTCQAPNSYLASGVRVGSTITGPDLPSNIEVDAGIGAHNVTWTGITPSSVDHSVDGALVTFNTPKSRIVLDWISAGFVQNGSTAAKELAVTICAENQAGSTTWTDFNAVSKALSSAAGKKDGALWMFPQGLITGKFGLAARVTLMALLDQASNGSFDLAVGYHEV